MESGFISKIKTFLRTLGIGAKELIDDLFVTETELDDTDFDKGIKRLTKRLKRQKKAINKLTAKSAKWDEKLQTASVCIAELENVRQKTEEKLAQLKQMQANK